MISKLTDIEGHQQGETAKKTLNTLIDSANDDVNFLINQITSSIGEQVSKGSSSIYNLWLDFGKITCINTLMVCG